jgi:hypothetical protein
VFRKLATISAIDREGKWQGTRIGKGQAMEDGKDEGNGQGKGIIKPTPR